MGRNVGLGNAGLFPLIAAAGTSVPARMAKGMWRDYKKRIGGDKMQRTLPGALHFVEPLPLTVTIV